MLKKSLKRKKREGGGGGVQRTSILLKWVFPMNKNASILSLSLNEKSSNGASFEPFVDIKFL